MRRALLIVTLLAVAVSCRRPTGELRIHILYSARASATPRIQQVEREFSFTDPRLHSCKPFHTQSSIASDVTSMLQDTSRRSSYDLFLLSSAAEIPDVPDIRRQMGDAFSLCGDTAAYIPDWVAEEKREGAARFVQYVATNCH